MAVKEASNEKLMGAIAYLGGPVTGIIFLLVEKTNPFIRFHAMQSTVVFGLISLILIAFNIVPILGTIILVLLFPLIFLLCSILDIFLMIKAFYGEKYKLPYFGDLAEKQLAKLK